MKAPLQIVSASFALVALTSCGPKFFNESYFDDLVSDQNPASLAGPAHFTITDISPTANDPLTLSIGALPPDAVDYCIQENNTSPTSCVWSSGAPLGTYTPSTSDGDVVLSIWLRDSSGSVSSRLDSNMVYVDYLPPAIASLAVSNASPTNTQVYGLVYGSITGTYAQYCIRENNTSSVGCTWNSGGLPSTFTVSSTENAKILSLWLRDAAGNLSNRVDSNSVTLDLTVPQLASVAITNPTPTSSATLNLSYGAVSNGPYTQYCVKENSITLAGLGDSCWVASTLPATFTVTASDGNKVLSVWIRDAAGNISNRVDSNTVYLDQTVPTVAFSTPAANAPINLSNVTSFTITGTCSENGRNVSLSGAVTGSVVCSGGAWSTTLDLSGLANNSAHTFYADHSDAAGNAAAQASRVFYKDVTAPTVAFSTPAGGSAVNSGNVAAFTVTGTCSENGRAVSLGGAVSTNVNCTAGNWSATLDLTSVADGPVTITANHTDESANAATQASRSFSKDTDPPAVAFSTPAANAYANASNYAAFVVTGTCSDSGQNVSLSGAVTASVACTAGGWSATLDLTAVSDGPFTLNADHSDAGANPAPQASRSFNKDISPVSVAFSTPSAGAYILPANVAAFTVTGTCSENGRTVALTGPVTANPTCSAGGWSATVDLSAIPDGLLTFYADHSDVGGNDATQATRGFTKDTEAPTSPLISINSGAAYTNSTAVSLTLTVTAAAQMYVTNVAGCGSGGAWASVNSPEAWTLGQTNGTATVYVKYRDVAGNETACVSDDIIHDSDIPTVAFTSPAPGSFVNAGNAGAFTVGGTCSENTRSVAISGAVTDSATCSGGTWTKILDLSAVADGAITIYADHSDAAGNDAVQASLSLTKNTGGGGANTIAINAGAGYTNSTAATLTLHSDSYTHEMYVTNVAGCGSGSVWETYSTSKAWTLGQTNATATVYVKFRDVALNETSCVNDTIVHDSIAPNAATALGWTETSPSGSTSLNANWTKSTSTDLANQSIRFYTDAGCMTPSGAAVNLGSNSLETYAWTAPGDGTYHFQVTSLDHIPHSTASACSGAMVVDTAPPAVAITLPAASSWVNIANVASWTISGTCSEAGRTVSLSGAVTDTATCSGGNTWSKTIDMTSVAQGVFTIHADHTDAAGNDAPQDSRAFAKDTDAPALASVDITNPSPTNTTTYDLTYGTITGTYTEYCQLENSTTVGSCGWTAGTVPATFTVSATQNAKVISTWLRDAAGNVSTRVDSDSVTLDTTNPTVAITSPNANVYVNLANLHSFLVSGTCSEAGRAVAISAASGAVTANPTCGGGNTWSTTLNFANELHSSWTPKYANLVGYWKMNGSGAITDGATVGSIIGPHAVAKNPNGSGMTYATGRLNQSAGLDGVDDVVIVPATHGFDFGTGAFSIGLWFYKNSAVGRGDLITWKDTSSGGPGDLGIFMDDDILKVYLPDTGNVGSGTPISAGAWHHLIFTRDSGNNVVVYIDGVSYLTSTDTQDMTAWATLPIYIGANHDDSWATGSPLDGKIDEVAFWNDSLSAGQVSTIYSRQSGGTVLNGSFTVLADHSDAAGNAAPQDSRTYNLDSDPPVVAITSPVENSFVNGANVSNWTISGTCSEIGSTVYLTGGITDDAVCSGSLTWAKTLNLSAVAQGAFTVNANLTDAGGNAATQSSRSFTKDTVAPTLAVTSPNGGEAITGATNVTWTATDAVSGVATNANSILIEYSSNGGSTWTTLADNEANDGTYSWASMPLESTNMLVRITAQDAAGNSSTDVSDAVFTYDTVAPTLAITSPAVDSWINSAAQTSFAVGAPAPKTAAPSRSPERPARRPARARPGART